MRFIKSDLLTLLVSLFILGSCKNPTDIGLDVNPGDALQTEVDSSIEVTAKLQKQDSILANFTNNSVLGYFKDPIFGETTANIAIGLTMPSTNFKFGTNPTLDSAVLVLPFLDFYGDSAGSSFVAEIRQLNEVLYNESGKNYYSNKKWSKISTVIGDTILPAKFRDSIIIQDIRTGKADSTKKVPAQVRIKLDANFIKTNIINLDSVHKISNTTFNNYIKGLFLSINKTSSTGKGGLFSFNTANNAGARLDVFYKATNASGSIDTLAKTFSINGANGNAATELTWDMAGTVVKTELENTNENSDHLYLKGLGGTFVKIGFPKTNLEKLKNMGVNVTINRAELIFYTESNTSGHGYDKPINRLRTYRWDIAQRPQLVPDELPSDPRYLGPGFVGGYYNDNTKAYVFNFTGYIQDLVSGKIKDYGTFIMPSDFASANGLTGLGRSVLGGASSNTPYKVKLKIFYTDQK